MDRTTWGISSLDRRLPDGTDYPCGEVTAIHWFAYKMAGKYTISTSGVVKLSPAKANNWYPYHLISKEKAMGWCQDAITADKIKVIDAELTQRVEEKLKQASGLPWGTPDPLPPLPYPLGYVDVN
jgi:hypothetical protein